MPKYRSLTLEELELLKDDFIKFLIVQGYDNAQWEKTKNELSDEAKRLIDLFSDIVIEKSLSNIQCLEHFDGKSMKIFKCEDKEISLVAINADKHFTSWHEMTKEIQSDPNIFSIYKTSKPYSIDRNAEVYKMLNSGASIGNAENFEILSNLRVHSEKS